MNCKIAWLLISSTFFFACNSTEENSEPIASSRISLSLNHEGTPISNELSNAAAFLYKQNAFVEKTINITPDQDGYYVVESKNATPDKLLFLAGNYPESIRNGSFSYTDMQKEKSIVANFTTSFPQLFYTGERALGSVNNVTLDLSLLRSVARLDLTKKTQLDVLIDSCVITNLATQTYLLPNNSTPIENLEYKRLLLGTDKFVDFNTKGSLEGITYLYESTGAASTVTLYVVINGIKNVLEAPLPEKIERNKRYEIEINSNGAYYKANIHILPWEEGSSIEANPKDFVAKIDNVNSNFPDGVWANAENDTLYVGASFEGSFTLALEAPTETEIKIESSQFQVSPIYASRSNYTGNQFEISASMNELNRPTTTTNIYVKKKLNHNFTIDT